MRLTIVPVLCALALVAATARADASPRGADACDLMEQTFKLAEKTWYANLSEQRLGRGSYSCQWTQGKVNEHALSLYVFSERSAAAAASALVRYAPPSYGPRIRLQGAEEARGKELKRTRRSSSSRVGWRQGRYVCLLSIAGIGDSGDLESALELARRFIGRLSRQGVRR